MFQEILKIVGEKPNNGKRNGGIKVHTLIRADVDVPCFIRTSSAASHDATFLKHIHLPPGSIITFDRGYVDYTQYNRLTNENVSLIIRMRTDAVWVVEKDRPVNEMQQSKGIISDQVVTLGNLFLQYPEKAFKNWKNKTRKEAPFDLFINEKRQGGLELQF